MTRSEAEAKRQKAVEPLRRIGKPEDAERFAATTPEDYAAHKDAELSPIHSGGTGSWHKKQAPPRPSWPKWIDDIEDLLEEALEPELTDD